MKAKKPIVELVSFTPNSIELMLWAFKNMLGMVSKNLEEFVAKEKITQVLKREFMQYVAADPLTGGAQEFVSTVWYLGDVSRAFQQQLTRCRTAAYCIQSLRIKDKSDFAQKRDYLVPDDVKNKGIYEYAIGRVEEMYNKLIKYGEETQVARGVLPLNVYSPITLTINLRNLRHLLSYRLCNKAQGEIQTVAVAMVREVIKKMGSEFKFLFGAPCEQIGFCSFVSSCGKSKQLPVCKNKWTDSIDKFIKQEV